MLPPSFRSYTEYDPVEQDRLEEVLRAARAQKVSRSERRRRVVVSFWGFGERTKCSTLVACLKHAFRTRNVYCSDVHEQRFEGMICIFRTQLSVLQEICNLVKMCMDTLDVGECTEGKCLRCNTGCLTPCFMACLKRLENGEVRRGEHPSMWGSGFRDLIMDMQVNENVVKVTGLPFDANNMIMLHFSHRAAEQHSRRFKERADALGRETRRLQYQAQRASMLETENCRMMFALQRAYRAGAIKPDAFYEIMCGMESERYNV